MNPEILSQASPDPAVIEWMLEHLPAEEQAELWELVERRSDGEPLLPHPFNEDTPESAWRFLMACRTWNESEEEVQFFPGDKPYLEEYVWMWHEAKRVGATVICEKCRRMLISWTARALELHQLCLRRSDQVLCGADFEAAAKHVWRIRFIYEDLQTRFPEWKLPACKWIAFEGKYLKSLTLANGATVTYANGAGGTVRGDGAKIVTLEEFATYASPSDMISAAKIICQPSARAKAEGKPGGFVNCISNSGTSAEWKQIKFDMDQTDFERELEIQRKIRKLVKEERAPIAMLAKDFNRPESHIKLILAA